MSRNGANGRDVDDERASRAARGRYDFNMASNKLRGLDAAILAPKQDRALDVRNEPMVREERGASVKPPPSPTKHATPRNRALEVGTRAAGFAPPLTGSYSSQAGAPLGVAGVRRWDTEQARREGRAPEARNQAGNIPAASGFRFKADKV